MSDFNFTPVVIIGAARSGTNMLRDALTRLEGFDTWPCDEINPIWRHGNLNWPNDEIPATRAEGEPKRYIRKAFQRFWRESKPRYVVEKTCANSLRVPFVNAVLPETKFVYIVRDGVDVVASAQKRWKGEMELPSLPYYWAKIKYAPLIDLPAYGVSFVKNRIAMKRSAEKRMDVWGPRFAEMDAMGAAGASLDAVCATQWVESVDQADAAFTAMPEGKVHQVRYEDFTADPEAALKAILSFLGEDTAPAAIVAAVALVSRGSVGKGRKALAGDAEALMAIMHPTLARHGYTG